MANGFTDKREKLDWFVVQTKPREEIRARFFLSEKGLETYLPLIEVEKRRRNMSVMCTKPLFPGYLFCKFNVGRDLSHVRWTQGVTKILPETEGPVEVSADTIAAISVLESNDGVIRRRSFTKNDRLRVVRGPWKNLVGIFEHWSSDKGRVRILLEIIGYTASLELHHSFVEKLG